MKVEKHHVDRSNFLLKVMIQEVILMMRREVAECVLVMILMVPTLTDLDLTSMLANLDQVACSFFA